MLACIQSVHRPTDRTNIQRWALNPAHRLLPGRSPSLTASPSGLWALAIHMLRSAAHVTPRYLLVLGQSPFSSFSTCISSGCLAALSVPRLLVSSFFFALGSSAATAAVAAVAASDGCRRNDFAKRFADEAAVGFFQLPRRKKMKKKKKTNTQEGCNSGLVSGNQGAFPKNQQQQQQQQQQR